MAISDNFHWAEWIGDLSKTRKVIAIEMQGHGRTADTGRYFTYDNLADDVSANSAHRLLSLQSLGVVV